MQKRTTWILIVIFAVVFLYSACQLLGIFKTYETGRQTYDSLEQYASMEQTETGSKPLDFFDLTIQKEDPAETPDVSAWPQVSFEDLTALNADIIGWSYIDGTNINYPVVQGTDNDFYLTHLFDGTYNSSGCIFLDYRCAADFSDRNTIIYGHHMKNNSMFSALMAYKEQAFYDEHPTVLLVTPDAYLKVQLFSGYITDNYDRAWERDLDDAAHAVWLQDVAEKSLFTPDCTPAPEDGIVTLSTCTYEFEDAKFVLHGYISERIETPLTD